MSDPDALLKAGQIDDAIVEFVERRQYVSFPELARFLGAHMPVDGDCCIGPNDYEFILFWVNLSEDLAARLCRLRSEKRIHYHPASLFVYLIDGLSPSLPIAKSVRKYTKPHWLPVTICTFPLEPKKTSRSSKRHTEHPSQRQVRES